jgi:hypothetical protein
MSLALFAYIGIAVLKQSDTELILPSSRFNLGVLPGVPGGAFVAPLLQIEIPLVLFYTLMPPALLVLHATLVSRRRLLRDAAAPLRFAAIWLPPLVLGLIRWRFIPYVTARPEPPPLSGVVLEKLQVVALAADAAVVAIALLKCRRGAAEDPGDDVALLTRSMRNVGFLFLAMVLLSGLSWQFYADSLIAVGVLLLLAIWIAEGRTTRSTKSLTRIAPATL